MTATSALFPTARTNAWRAIWRAAALVLVILAVSLAAFAVGRSSAHTRQQSPVIAPSSVSHPSSPAVSVEVCRPGHLC